MDFFEYKAPYIVDEKLETEAIYSIQKMNASWIENKGNQIQIIHLNADRVQPKFKPQPPLENGDTKELSVPIGMSKYDVKNLCNGIFNLLESGYTIEFDMRDNRTIFFQETKNSLIHMIKELREDIEKIKETLKPP